MLIVQSIGQVAVKNLHRPKKIVVFEFQLYFETGIRVETGLGQYDDVPGINGMNNQFDRDYAIFPGFSVISIDRDCLKNTLILQLKIDIFEIRIKTGFICEYFFLINRYGFGQRK